MELDTSRMNAMADNQLIKVISFHQMEFKKNIVRHS